jgi:hypothetical protein
MKTFLISSFKGLPNVALILLLASAINTGLAQVPDDHFTIESYYKVKWGYAQEFINLWTANHYPLQKKAMENGDIISIKAEKPKEHSGEDTRWDFRVTVVYKNAEVALDHSVTDPYKKQLYPDLAKLAKDEQYRFTLLIAHWDLFIEKIELK